MKSTDITECLSEHIQLSTEYKLQIESHMREAINATREILGTGTSAQ